ncbi:MAG TPA: PHP domain-containing protein [Streptosporangiaceae bacterium]
MSAALRLDEDFHVHSTFSDDGASTLAENVETAQERGLSTLCLADHVRRDTAWLPEFLGAVSAYRRLDGLAVLAGVEAKILDAAGHLDLPPGLRGRHADADAADGLDLVLIADHQFPGEGGPVHPARLRTAIEQRELSAQEAIEQLVKATVRAAAHAKKTGLRPLVAHLFSLLPKSGLAEDQVPQPLLRELAAGLADSEAMVEVNEKWRCPSARTIGALRAAGVPIVAGSDSHHRRDIGRYASVRTVASGPDP